MLRKAVRKGIVVFLILFSTVLTTGCGKSSVKTNVYNGNEAEMTEKFCESFFSDSNLPYTKITLSDVNNTPDEYLFYINGGKVYRTLNDYCVVIVNRRNITESEQKKGKNYCGEIYHLFGEESTDILKISATGEYAILSMPSTIPDYENNVVIQSSMNYSTNI